MITAEEHRILSRLKVGDPVIVKSEFGRGPVVEGVIICIDFELPGIDYKVKEGGEFWAYPHQIFE